MKFFDGLSLALQNLNRTKFRSFLTILGVVIGISAIVSFVSLGLGLQKITSDQIAGVSALTTLTVSPTPATSTMEAGPKIDQALIDKIKQIKNVEKCSESVNLPTSAESGGTSAGALVYGINTENAEIEVSGITLGKNLSAENEAVISSALANSFSTNHDTLLGKEISVKIIKSTDGQDFQSDILKYNIVGIDNNDTTALVYVPIDKIYKAGGFDGYSALKVKVKSRSDIMPVKNEIKNSGYQITTIQDLIEQIDKIFLIVEIILGVVGGIGLLVSSLGIINTMTISFLERTREIGIMKAIGATGGDIKRLFFLESAIIGFLGGIGGVATAYLFGYTVNFVINYLIKDSGQQLYLFITPFNFSAIMVLAAVLISVMAGIYPTWRAQRLSPIEAIRQ